MSDVRVGLGLIVKDEVDALKRILTDYKSFFDEIQITITNPSRRSELEKLCAEHGAIASYYDWMAEGHKLFPFDLARNFNKKQFTKSDYYFRLDSDDAIKGAQNIRKVAQKAKDMDVSLILCFYEYARDEWGNVVAGHNRETLIQCSDNLYWNKHIHENILPKDEAEHTTVIDENIVIVHLASHEDAEQSSARNLKYLLAEYNEDKENTDPRTIAYLGRVFFGMGDYEKAVFFLQKHIEKSGWDEDRYLSWCYLSELYIINEDYEKAKACCLEAIAERPDYPNAYHSLSFCYYIKKEWMKAIEFGKIGATKKAPQTTMLIDPSASSFRPAVTMALSYFQQGKFLEAKKLFDYAKSMAPTHPFIKENASLFDNAVLHKAYIEKFSWMLNYLRKEDDSKIRSLVESIPDSILEEPEMTAIKHNFITPKKWKEGSVVFYCGRAWEEWGPKSVESGIGGSEEAVIHMARELVKLGHEVTVFNSCGEQEGVHDGVNYSNYFKFNRNDEFDTLITWRNSALKYGLKAHRKILWIHDVPSYILNDYDERAFTDMAIVLSEYHKSLLIDKMPEEKIFVSTNGVNLSDFIFDEKIERNPKRMIYASSYERGLEELLGMWADIRKEVPDAELHVYYGWNTYDKMFAEGACDGKLKKIVDPLLNQEGVIHHGRVGHKELAKEYAKAGIWVYPSKFPEISCIAAMKAQVAGCVPMCTDFAALKETVKAGIIVPGNISDATVAFEWKQSLIELLKDPAAQEEVREAVLKNRGRFAWSAVARQWSEDLFPQMSKREFIDCRFKWIKSKCNTQDKIVDIGGNDGHTFEDWNRDNVTTVDLDEYEVPNFIRANAESLPLEDKTFDVACLNEILEHIPNPVDALKEAGRVARRKIIITVPNEHEWSKKLDPMTTVEDKEKASGKSREVLALEGNTKVKDIYRVDNLHHLWHCRYYTKEMLEQQFKEAGFTNYSIVKLSLGEWSFWGAEINL